MIPHPIRRTAIPVLLVGLLSACMSTSSTQPSGKSAPAGPTASGPGDEVGGTSLVDAAAKVKDACSLMPADLAARLVPGGSTAPPVSPVPPRCTFTNGTSVLEITIGAFDTGGPVEGAESIPGLAAGAYLEKPVPDSAYLTVLLSPDRGALYVEVAGHDGKDHKDDAIAVAQQALAALA